MLNRPSKPRKTAADKRKSADEKLEARIAARKATVIAVEGTELPFVSTEPVVAASAPAPVVVKAKRTPKPRQPKADLSVSDAVTKIAGKAVAKASKAHKKELGTLIKAHKATVSRLNKSHTADLKAHKVAVNAKLKEITRTAKAAQKLAVEVASKRAYAAGVKAGAKQSTKGILAALKVA